MDFGNDIELCYGRLLFVGGYIHKVISIRAVIFVSQGHYRAQIQAEG